MSIQVSAVIIAFNEEADIARAVDSVSWCNEVLVIDSGSTDRTVEICAARGCKVIHHTFTGYGEQKAFAVAQAANDWVFVVDADEEVTPALRDEIQQRLSSSGDCYGYHIPITTILWDKVVRPQDRHTAAKLRLFDRRHGNFQLQLVHESVILDGRTELLRERMYNHSYANIADYFEKFNRYTTAGALQCLSEGRRSSVLGALARLPLTFLQYYIGKGHVRDGATGAMWSLFSALNPTVKHLKLWELQRTAHLSLQKRDVPDEYAQATASVSPTVAAPSAEVAVPIRRSLWRAASGRAKRLPVFILASAACAVSLAFLWKPMVGKDAPRDYAACLLFAVLVAACVWGYRVALLVTALSILALDYFTIGTPDSLSMPRIEDIYRMGLFLALSLLTISVVYRSERRPAR
jgi:Glycosyl transferase family 2/Domain of unknown function (DUF4118)